MDKKLSTTFLEVVRTINNTFGIVPILYGSFGLEKVIKKDLRAKDIDILVSDNLLQKKWLRFMKVISRLGFALSDVSEHEFIRDGEVIAFAPESDLQKLIGVTPRELDTTEISGVRFKELTAVQYLRVYKYLRKDPNRVKSGKSKHDEQKIKLIEDYLIEKKLPPSLRL